MQNTVNIALSRLVAQQRAMDLTANNIANADTPGFKQSRMLFADWLSRQTAADPVPGGRTLAYAQDRASYRDTAQGPLQHTANPLDLAITGPGYFTVQTKDGPLLTRAGKFELMSDGTVADAGGNALLDNTGRPLRASANDTRLTVTGDGVLASENGQLGQIGVVIPADPNRLEPRGNQWLAAQTATSQAANPSIVAGALEGSNVEPIVETTRMMNELREFQFTSQFIQAEDDRQQSAIDKITQHEG